jgi:hypothetical protein
MVKYLPYILLALAFVVLLLTLMPYHQQKQQKIANFRCPSSEWVDCMPGPDKVKPECDPTYLQWASQNCPNFRGAAL